MNIQKMRILRIVFVIVVITVFVVCRNPEYIYAQNINMGEEGKTEGTGDNKKGTGIGFMGIYVGMTREEVLDYADSNNLIHVPKNRDVELFPVEERKILAFSVNPEIPHIYLQFYNDVLYAITVIFDQKYIDYETLCNRLEEKYGEYEDLSPDWRKWKVDNVEIKVERPATVKYIALEEFLKVTKFKKNSNLSENERIKIFLDGL